MKETELSAAAGPLSISETEFRQIRALAYRHFGINLSEEKQALVQGRLSSYVRGLGFASFAAYLAHLGDEPKPALLVELVNRISTNHTYFFRENEHFAFLANTVLPDLAERARTTGSRDIRIWSAGCSSGEEPYSILVTMKEFFGADYQKWDAGVLATDISEKVLLKAREGIYPRETLEKIPHQLRLRYFQPVSPAEVQVGQELRGDVTFRRFNLMNEKFPFKKPFDVIFCRNVMIYFDQKTRDALVARFFDCTANGGYLFIGHSESLLKSECPYDYIAPAIYRRTA